MNASRIRLDARLEALGRGHALLIVPVDRQSNTQKYPSLRITAKTAMALATFIDELMAALERERRQVYN